MGMKKYELKDGNKFYATDAITELNPEMPVEDRETGCVVWLTQGNWSNSGLIGDAWSNDAYMWYSDEDDPEAITVAGNEKYEGMLDTLFDKVGMNDRAVYEICIKDMKKPITRWGACHKVEIVPSYNDSWRPMAINLRK